MEASFAEVNPVEVRDQCAMIAVIMERMLAVQAMVMVVIPGRISGENTNHVLNILYRAYPLDAHQK